MTSTTSTPDPPADREARRADFRAYYDAEAADRALRPMPSWRDAAREEFLARLTDERSRTVLEVGCGPGLDGAAFTAAGFAYTGADLSPGMVEVARAASLDAHVASATDLPFEDHSFDAVWSMSTLMHLDDTELDAALSEIIRVLVPGGLFAVGMWGASELTVGPAAKPDEDYGPPRYFHRRTDAMVRERLGEHGEVESWWTRLSRPGSGHRYQYAVVRALSPRP
ncbi:class I SAM-dependent methyltransferase [Promicromonospora iranensis]|uniref:SAM-dependent methyltransferase n=1 Tax=Promicromonospora iranensis TaxID=1105144 RepID=A0ABU2CJ72_9MICO|nr:class I SAM-dependent methyltransferase [Promicromonospora iranensis]MDR7381363.1 SAM-dependent methyltransferase [Promicromonospora iranensis]